MSHIPSHTPRRGWQAVASRPGWAATIAVGPAWWCHLAAWWHRLRHPTDRVRVEPIP